MVSPRACAQSPISVGAHRDVRSVWAVLPERGTSHTPCDLMVEVIHVAPRRQRDDTVYLDADGFLFVAQNFPQIETYRTERTVVVVHDVQFSREVLEHFMCQHVDHLRIVCLSNPLLGSFFAQWRCPFFCLSPHVF